jgi:hypothetical protein
MRLINAIAVQLILFVSLTPFCRGESLFLEWNPNGESDLAGYNVYYGTSPGSYGNPVDVGDVTTYELTELDAGVRYYVAITAYDTAENESEKSDEESGVPTDTEDPTVTITVPTTSPTYSTAASIISIAGSASDNLEVTEVNWANNRGGAGLASGTSNWSASNIALQVGINIITVTARDAADNTGIDSITITYTPPTTTTSAPTTTTTAPTTTTSAPTTTSIPGTTTIPVTTTTVPAGNNSLSGSITINSGEEVTTSREVTLTLYAAVEVPQLASSLFAEEELGPDGVMCISNDGEQWSSLEPYQQTKQWTLEPGNGVKTVYAGFRDSAGNWISEPAQDQIILEEAQTTCGDPQKLQPLSVTASSTFPRYSTDNLIDGDPSTMWSSVVSLFKKEEHITLDLGTTKKISALTMHASRLFGVDLFPTNFKIQISQDNSTWLDITTVQGFVFGQSLTSGSWDTNGLECRYIRIFITQSKALFLLFKLAQIAEVEVYGCDTSGAVPLLAGESSFAQSNKEETALAQRETSRKTENKDRIPGTPSRPTVTFLE